MMTLKPDLLLSVIRGVLILFLATIIFSGKAQPGHSQEERVMNPGRFVIEAGGYLSNLTSQCRIGAEGLGLGLNIDFEQALGLESRALTYFGSFNYRFGRNLRHTFRARYFEIIRGAKKELEADLHIGDQVFTFGTELGTYFALRVINADYGYAFVMNDRIMLSGSFGFFIMPIRLTFEENDQKVSANEFVAPLPVIGLESRFLLSEKFILRQGLHVLFLKLGDLSGEMMEMYISLDYKPTPWLGIGLGYSYFNVDVRQGEDAGKIFGELVGSVGYRQTGILLHASFYF